MLRKPNALRVVAAAAIIGGSFVVWVVQRTIARAQESNQWVAHTQEVLTALDTVLASIVDAVTAVRGSVLETGTRNLGALDRAERTIDADSIDLPR